MRMPGTLRVKLLKNAAISHDGDRHYSEEHMELKWSKNLATGNEEIDEQHQSIFQSIEHLETAVRDERTMYAVYAINMLAHYVQNHFATEEALMRQQGYPGIVQHVAEHEELRRKVRVLSRKSIYEDVSMEVIDLLRDWLINHIAKADMAYVPYLGQEP